MTAPALSRRGGRALLDPAALAAAADRVRAVVAGAVELAQAGVEVERVYGGPLGLRRALGEHLLRAEDLALELSRAAACAAGTWLLPVANEPAGVVGGGA